MWDVLSGTLEVVRDLKLEDLGRKRFHVRRNPSFSPQGYVEISGRQLFRVAFAARRIPWRLAVIKVQTDYAIPDAPRDDDVAIEGSPLVEPLAMRAVAVVGGARPRRTRRG